MIITVSHQAGRIPFTVLHLRGDLDASNYTKVIQEARDLYDRGARDLLIDLSQVSYVSSAGLIALHATMRIFAGEAVRINEAGRPSFRAPETGFAPLAPTHVKLLGPQPQVDQVLEVAGLKPLFQSFNDLESALKSL